MERRRPGPSQPASTHSDSFQQFKASLTKAGRLYVDSEFPAGPAALGRSGKLAANKNIVWKRPKVRKLLFTNELCNFLLSINVDIIIFTSDIIDIDIYSLPILSL